MQLFVILFLGILSVVRATPFGLDSGDRPTPFRYSFRVEKVEFGNDVISEYSEPEGYYETDDYYTNELYESSQSDLQQLFGDLEYCGDLENGLGETNIPEEGCVYFAGGNVHFLWVLSEVDVDEVYEALENEGLEECDDGIEVIDDVPEGGCFIVDERSQSVHLISVYDDELTDDIDEMTNELKEQIGNLELCDVTQSGPPEGGCVLLSDNKVGLINVLNEENIVYVLKEMTDLNLLECDFDDEHRLTTTEECYWIYKQTNSIIFENVNIKDVPDRQSSVTKKAKAALVKKVLSRQQAQSTQEKRRRQTQRSGRKDNNGGRANHLPMWMKH